MSTKHKFRHTVDIKRPSTTLGSRGQVTGSPSTVASAVPCSIETLSGDELMQAQKQFSRATYRVEMYGDPAWALTTNDYLLFGSRSLFIGRIDDEQQNDKRLVMICGEEK